MRRIATVAAASMLAIGSTLLAAMPFVASAHESRSVADDHYQIVVGFIDEPVFAGDKSGLEFWVTDISAATPTTGDEPVGDPVEGLEKTLKAEVIFGDQTMELPLEATFDQPGGYNSVFFPMEPGDYTFRIFGKIGDTDIDESFTSSPEGFSPVEDPAPVRFPKAG